MSTLPAVFIRLWNGPQVLAPDIQREVLRSLWPGKRHTSLLAATIAITLLAGSMWILNGDSGAVIWALIMYVVQFIRWRVIRATAMDATARASTGTLHGRAVGLALLFSGTWALAPWMFFPSSSMAVVALMAFFVMGLIQVGVAAVASYWPALRVFLPLTPLSLALRLFIEASWISVVLGAAVLIMLACLILFSWEQNSIVTQSIINRVENEKLANELRLRLADIERLSGEKTRLFAAANHDLRQPLHALSLFATALSGDLKDPASLDRLRHMQRAIAALETSFNLMLDISRLDSGKAEAVREPVALAPVFRALNDRFAEPARLKGLSLRFAPTQACVTGDPVMIDRLLGNLIDNAIKYTTSGSVWVGARLREKGGAWLVEVRDSGIGIAPEMQSRVFEEFFQVDNAGRDRERGLGLGLAIVRRLADTLGFTLTLRSAIGRGSCFAVRMPARLLADVLASSPAARSDEALPPLAARILVLDDEPAIRAGMEVLLRQWGCQTVTVADESALEHVLANGAGVAPPAFDVLIADMRLPGARDGLQIAQDALARRQVGAFLVLTGETTPATLARIEASGCPVLLKPVDPAQLHAALGALVTDAATDVVRAGM
ncbi:hybrid sensor histidine kinase/response regulator [Reyranella sp. CPCC 100927]|uniref:ATP-binding response regulator n=1 Tax=Reyranella sp. CPCC 100927 TaxID=2599616 RepID=UPI0015B59CC9|nr:hybrid sensor histidine kinase/response regulator [Reyranella sp. CPCC 100927]